MTGERLREDCFLRFLIQGHGKTTEDDTSDGNGHRKPKRRELSAKGLRQRVKKPGHQRKPVLRLARFVNLAVSQRNQVLQITTDFRFGRKGHDFGQAGGGAFVKIMKPS